MPKTFQVLHPSETRVIVLLLVQNPFTPSSRRPVQHFVELWDLETQTEPPTNALIHRSIMANPTSCYGKGAGERGKRLKVHRHHWLQEIWEFENGKTCESYHYIAQLKDFPGKKKKRA